MSEIDFDELDKAVKQLMGGVAKVASDDEPKQKMLTLTDTLQPGEKPAYDRLGKVAEGIGSETLITNGEHESISALDGKLPGDGRPPVLPVGSAMVPEREAPQRPSQESSRGTPAPRPARGRFMDVVHHSSDMTTSNTLQASGDTPVLAVAEPEVAAPEVTEPQSEVVPTNKDDDSAIVSSIEPLKTPFLPDAKVEKRPLGAIDQPVEESVAEVLASSASKQFEDVPAESSSTTNIDNFANVSADSADAQAPADPVELAAESAESLELQKIEAAEIEAESRGKETPEGGIYDVNSYHQPINHPAKQKSSWAVIGIILVIILLAAALGAGAFFLLNLDS